MEDESWGSRVSAQWHERERQMSLTERMTFAPKPPVLMPRGTFSFDAQGPRPIDPATEWSGSPQTTAVEYRSHIRLVDVSAMARKRRSWALVELLPEGEPPGQTTRLALVFAVFRLCWISMLGQATVDRQR